MLGQNKLLENTTTFLNLCFFVFSEAHNTTNPGHALQMLTVFVVGFPFYR